MFLEIDQDIDFRVSAKEINDFIKWKCIPLDMNTGPKLFEEITQRRVVIHEG